MLESSQAKPRCAQRLSIDPPQGGARVVYDPQRDKYFRIGVREARFLESLDGTLDASELPGHGDHGRRW